MPVDSNAEILGLRTMLRDLVALSAIPVAWVGREPSAVAAGLADALIGLLQLEFVSVRLGDPRVAGAVEATRGTAWKTFPQWLERHLAENGQLSRKEIIPDLDGSVDPYRGVVFPIGVNAEAGLVAAACDRPDFPEEIDELLLCLAANHAATAFQSAQLINERKRAEDELRKAQNELELKVAERTAELQRSRAELAASRARVVTAADEMRRRIERNLHDGVQQRLVSLALAQRSAQATVPPELQELQASLSRVTDGLASAVEELQEIARGIHPAILARGGLGAALQTLVRRSAVPVDLEIHTGPRLPEPVEVAIYYIVSEALTNTAKHAKATAAYVAVKALDGVLTLWIRDDGIGGADATGGSGLIGLTDRVEALGGTITVASAIGEGTTLHITFPIEEGPSSVPG
jgi:signal transduction histidine kinase